MLPFENATYLSDFVASNPTASPQVSTSELLGHWALWARTRSQDEPACSLCAHDGLKAAKANRGRSFHPVIDFNVPLKLLKGLCEASGGAH